MPGKKSIRRQVKDYLSSQGIERLTFDRTLDLIDENGKNSNVVKTAFNLNIPIQNRPDIYDEMQTFQVAYDFAVEAIRRVSMKLNKMQEESETPLVITDGGCATGLHTCFFGQSYPQHQVRGYDCQEEMVERGKQRVREMGLKNTKIYTGDHFEPKDWEKKGSDLLLIKDPIDVNQMKDVFANHGNEDFGESIDRACQRLKPGGLCVYTGACACTPERIKEELRVADTDYEGCETWEVDEMTQKVYMFSFRK